ncbi:TolC family protein [Eudoraea sp.]|uniref:TolC family protein n=1 Tax=Eudoraea sp. TaxID=1979955 RepID=UPI003C769B0A
MKIKITIALLFLILSGTNMSAQQVWSLDDCVNYAIEHNLFLKDFKYATESDEETFKQSKRSLLPNLSANTSYTINQGRTIDPNDNSIVNSNFFSNDYNLQAQIDVFRGFQKINVIKASKLAYKATQEETLQQKYLLSFRVMKAFYDIKFFEGLLAISLEQEALSQNNVDLVNRQIELGLKAGADKYEAESLLLRDQLNVTQSKNQLAAAKLSLIQEMNLENTSDINIQAGLVEKFRETNPQEIITNAIYEEAMGFLPIIKAQELRTLSAQKDISAARGNLYPSLSLFGGYGTGYFETIKDSLGMTIPFRNQFQDNAAGFVGVALNIPILNGWSFRSRIKQQKIALDRAENNLDLQEQELFQTIQQLVQEYNSLLVEYDQSFQNMEAQNLAFTIAQKRYDKGMISALDLFTAKNLFAISQNENLQVRLRAEINKSTLDFYRGLPVFNYN